MRTLGKRGSAARGLMKDTDAILAVNLVSKAADKNLHLLGIHAAIEAADVPQQQRKGVSERWSGIRGNRYRHPFPCSVQNAAILQLLVGGTFAVTFAVTAVTFRDNCYDLKRDNRDNPLPLSRLLRFRM